MLLDVRFTFCNSDAYSDGVVMMRRVQVMVTGICCVRFNLGFCGGFDFVESSDRQVFRKGNGVATICCHNSGKRWNYSRTWPNTASTIFFQGGDCSARKIPVTGFAYSHRHQLGFRTHDFIH
jgi:hypothetical protein